MADGVSAAPGGRAARHDQGDYRDQGWRCGAAGGSGRQAAQREGIRAELARLDDLEEHPEFEERRKRSEQKDQERVDRLMGMLPDAFLYRMEGIEPCAAGRCYRLSFAPNPKWQPPDLESEFFRGVEGEAWISQSEERLTRVDARFFTDVNLGFGILARINKGGTVQLEQTDVGGGDWELTGLTMHISGRALLVKALNFQIKETARNFSPVRQGMGYVAAIETLKQMRTDGAAGER